MEQNCNSLIIIKQTENNLVKNINEVLKAFPTSSDCFNSKRIDLPSQIQSHLSEPKIVRLAMLLNFLAVNNEAGSSQTITKILTSNNL
jgi:hypothetical protein